MFHFFKKKSSITSYFPENYVDIHSHIIPGIDDGSKNLEASVAMLQRMSDFGIQHFILTPHIMEGVWENTSEIIQHKLSELKNHLNSINFHPINIQVAAEYMLDSNFNKLVENKDLLVLKDNKILIEMSYFNAPINIYDILFKIQIAGYTPVLAHPERYTYLHSKYNEFKKLKEAGCLFQLNLLSLSNYYGKSIQSVAVQLLKDNLIDFVGSDVHNQYQIDTLESINNPKIIQLVLPVLEKNTLFI